MIQLSSSLEAKMATNRIMYRTNKSIFVWMTLREVLAERREVVNCEDNWSSKRLLSRNLGRRLRRIRLYRRFCSRNIRRNLEKRLRWIVSKDGPRRLVGRLQSGYPFVGQWRRTNWYYKVPGWAHFATWGRLNFVRAVAQRTAFFYYWKWLLRRSYLQKHVGVEKCGKT